MKALTLFALVILSALTNYGAVSQAISINMSSPALSTPLYVGRDTQISANVTNTGSETLHILGISSEMRWQPRSTIFAKSLLVALQPNQTKEVDIMVPVPTSVIPTSIQYRLGINTTLGIWYDIWRNGIVMDYWLTAYSSLHTSIVGRLTDKHYESQDANKYARQAVDLLNEADNEHIGTEEGYNLLLKASGLIDQADQADAQWYQWQQNAPFYLLEAIGVIVLISTVFVILRSRKKRRTRKRHSRMAT